MVTKAQRRKIRKDALIARRLDIAECLDLQKEKSKDKSKKGSFNTRKFRKQIKKSLMTTWEDLDSESGSEKEEARDEANVAVGLVATLTKGGVDV